MKITSAAVSAAQNAGDSFGLELASHEIEKLLEAAAPLIAAQTLKDAARAYSGNPDGLTSNGHVRWFLEDMATELDPA